MKRIVSVILALVLVSVFAVCFSSCSAKIDASKDLDRVKNAGVLKVGMECAYAPFNWTQPDDSNEAVKIANADGYANGFDVRVAKRIADNLGVKLEIYQYKWEALIPAVESGALDCIIAGMSPTAERKESVDFSSNYYVSNLVLIVRSDSEYATATSIKDFDGAKVAAQDGTFHAAALDQIPNVQGSVMDDFTILYTAVTAGTIDAYIAEEPTAHALCTADSGLTYIELKNNDTGFTCDEGDTAIAVGLRKSSSLNSAISEIIDDTDFDANLVMLAMVDLAPAED